MTPEDRERFWTPELIAECKRLVDAAPPLSDEVRARLYALFAPVRIKLPAQSARRAS